MLVQEDKKQYSGDVWCFGDVFGVDIKSTYLLFPSSSSSDPRPPNLKPPRQPVRYCALVRLSLASGRRFGMVGHLSSTWDLGSDLGDLNTKKTKLHVLWHPSSFLIKALACYDIIIYDFFIRTNGIPC